MKKYLFLAMGLCLVAGTAFAADTIRIGLMGPMTGGVAREGQEMKQVLSLLVDEVNAKGGVLGKKVEVITEDDGGDPKTAALAAQRLVTQDVVVVIGTYMSSVTEATQNIYNEAKVIQIANGSTAVRLSEKGLKYFFRTSPRDDEQGKVITRTIEKMGVKKVALLHDNTTYAKGLCEEVKEPLAKKGVTTVFYDALTPGERDYTAILTKMKAAQPDIVFFGGYYAEGGLLLRQKQEMNWKVPFMMGDATSADLVKIAGKEAAAGLIFTTPPLPKDLTSDVAKNFLVAFTKKNGNPPNSIYPVLAGDGFGVAIAAIKATQSTDPQKLADYLHTSLKYSGLTGEISFNEKGDRVGETFRLYKIDPEGNFVLQQ